MKEEVDKIREDREKLGIIYNNCFSRTNDVFEKCGMNNPQLNTNTPLSLQVLGELYGSQRIFMPKGDFQTLPATLESFKDLKK